MPRKRLLTEHLGCMVSVQEIETVRQHAKAQHVSISDYLRSAAVRPLLKPPKDTPDDGPNKAA
jgi:hypothetical protein